MYKIEKLFQGDIVNTTENQSALHFKYRDVESEFFNNYLNDLKNTTLKINALEPKDIVVLGIGGSELGPKLVLDALKDFIQHPSNIHFLANVDSNTFENTIKKINFSKTVFIMCSKSFSTLETFALFEEIRLHFANEDVFSRSFAVTANPVKAAQYGFLEENICSFLKEVGGRYSIWSPIGLPVYLMCGENVFFQFLSF